MAGTKELGDFLLAEGIIKQSLLLPLVPFDPYEQQVLTLPLVVAAPPMLKSVVEAYQQILQLLRSRLEIM